MYREVEETVGSSGGVVRKSTGVAERNYDERQNSRIGYLLRRAQAAARAAFDTALIELGVNAPQFAILFALENYPGASSADLARTSTVTPQLVNIMVRNLEARGLLVRVPHPVHGRILQAELTKAGRALLKLCKRRVFAIEKQMVEGLTAPEERSIRRWLTRCCDRLRAQSQLNRSHRRLIVARASGAHGFSKRSYTPRRHDVRGM